MTALYDAILDGVTDKLTIRDVDEKDLDTLKAAAADQGTSLNRYVARVLHQQAARERHRKLFAAIGAQEGELAPFDAVAEVRAMRNERDAQDEEIARGEQA